MKELKETVLKLTNIQNDKLDKLTNTKSWEKAKWNTTKDGWIWK